MSKFSKHIGQGEPLEIDGEEFILKPLNIEHLPNFFKAIKAFSGGTGANASIEDTLKNLDDDGLKAIKTLIIETLKTSYPEEWKTNPEELNIFGLKYMHILIGKIFELNSATSPDVGAIKKAETIARLKAQQNANPTPEAPSN